MVPFITAFISGALLFNAIPHLVRGICGKTHMTPFAPRSSAWVNIVWAWGNIVAGVWIGRIFHLMQEGIAAGIGFGLGGFAVSLYLAVFWSNPNARLPWHAKE